MRQCQEAKQQEIFRSPVLAQIDRILIPHTPAEFAYPIPAALQPKSFFVGPIVRPLQAQTQAGLRAKYGLSDQHFLLISTVGGGGFADRAAAFFATVCEVHHRLSPHLPHLQHLVIQGPNFRHSEQVFSPQPGMTVIAHEPELSNLFALATLVIAEGGYNTVAEIRLAQVPAIFLPSKRKYDDQEGRVRALAQQGVAWVFTDYGAEAIAQTIMEFAASPQRASAIRARYATEGLAPGNRVAAERILEVIAQ
jgi:predicted glycosyltransferase